MFENMLINYYVGYCRGSKLYGTFKEGVSDEDYLYVVPDEYGDFLSQFPKGIGQYTKVKTNRAYCVMDIDGDWRYEGDLPDIECDVEFVTETAFLQMIDDNDIVALEAIFAPYGYWFGLTNKHSEYSERFSLNCWKLRQNVSSICSNSWVKCKKKLTVEKDYNLRIGQKSLFHSLRIYMFGIQIAEHGKITDYMCAKDLWKEIEGVENPVWDTYKEMYQTLFNGYRSKLVELCPKPEEVFKKKN